MEPVKRATLLAAALAAAGCAGRTPSRAAAPPGVAASAVLLGVRLVLPSGETRNGTLALGFESESSREQGQEPIAYELPVRGGEFYLFRVEPGFYRLAPTRRWTGEQRTDLSATIEGREYVIPFPRELLRQGSYELKPKKAVALGVLEAKVHAALPGQKGTLKIRMDDGLQARRAVVTAVIRQLMDPRRSSSEQANAAVWSRALQNMLMELQAEDEPRPTFKPAQ